MIIVYCVVIDSEDVDQDELNAEMEAVACNAFASYAYDCSEQGISFAWRRSDLCRKSTLQQIFRH